MKTLSDILQPKMRVLFVGTNPGKRSARIGHYFAGKTNMFWRLLYESKLTKEPLRTELDYRVQRYGYGLTDVIKRPTASTTQLKRNDGNGAKKRLDKIIRKYNPQVVAFVGKAGFRYYLENNNVILKYGLQKLRIGNSKVFLLPSSSGASFADTSYKQKLFWYTFLRKYVETIENETDDSKSIVVLDPIESR